MDVEMSPVVGELMVGEVATLPVTSQLYFSPIQVVPYLRIF